MATRVAEQGHEYSEKAQAGAKEFKPMVEKSLKKQPMTRLAGAAAAEVSSLSLPRARGSDLR
jgi:hypothetical protein